MARASAAERERRKASDEAAYARGRLTAIAYDQDVEEDALRRDNSGRVGGQPAVSWALVAALAAFREIKGLSYRELHGHLEEPAHGRCMLSASQLCRRTSAMGIRAFRGGLFVGGFKASFRERDGRLVIAVRRGRRAEPETAIEYHDGMAVITAGPGRAPSPARRSSPPATGAQAGWKSGGARSGGGTTTGPPGAAAPAPTGQWSRS